MGWDCHPPHFHPSAVLGALLKNVSATGQNNKKPHSMDHCNAIDPQRPIGPPMIRHGLKRWSPCLQPPGFRPRLEGPSGRFPGKRPARPCTQDRISIPVASS
ncbi:hypothetical protein TRIP_B200503 [uncultured Desulfatiglans sp.]|nr:hypothetical protein TRIP_B200503 [uncultured Desulfatiglans sp.]